MVLGFGYVAKIRYHGKRPGLGAALFAVLMWPVIWSVGGSIAIVYFLGFGAFLAVFLTLLGAGLAVQYAFRALGIRAEVK